MLSQKLQDLPSGPAAISEEDSATTSHLAQPFLLATGVNPEPLLLNIELIDRHLQTLLSQPAPCSVPPCSVPPCSVPPCSVPPCTVPPCSVPPTVVHTQVPSAPAATDWALLARLAELEAAKKELEAVKKELELMLQNQEQELRRTKMQTRHLEAIYEQSERQKQELLTQHQSRYEMIRRNYGRNSEVSTDVIHLLAKICHLEKRLREREIEANRDRDQQIANTKELYDMFEKLRAESRSDREDLAKRRVEPA